MKKTLRDLQLVELELLKEFLRICGKYHLRYFALGGTLLGAVRHQGFIPWDDDVDVGMPREDFDRFEEIVDRELPEGMRYLCYRRTPDYHYYVPRLTDCRVKVADNASSVRKIRDAWIDIFPLDGMPSGALKRKIHASRLLAARAALNLSLFSTNVDLNKPNRPLPEKILIGAGKVLPVEKIFHTDACMHRLDRLMRKYPFDRSAWIINFMGIHKLKEMFHRKHYGKGALYPFEDVRLRGPADCDFVLTQMYGDYMSPPPEEEKNHHSTRILDDGQQNHRTTGLPDDGQQKPPASKDYSVLMSVYARENPAYLRAAIHSMKQQTLPFSELVLICDGPLNTQLERVLAEEQTDLGERLRIIRLPENVGLGNALRTGLLYCRYPVVARMDSDDISRKTRCEKEMERISEGFDLTGSAILEFNETPGDTTRARLLPETEEEIRRFALKRNPFNHGTVMFRKDAVLKAGSYQDFPGFEDYSLWIRMLQNGCRVCNIPEILLDMRIGNGLSSRRGGLRYIRNVIRFQNRLRKTGLIGPVRYLLNCQVRVMVAVIPAGLRDRFYSRFLRRRNRLLRRK